MAEVGVYERVAAEIQLVRLRFPAVRHGDKYDWILVPEYPLPQGRFTMVNTNLLFRLPPGYPSTGPDDFFVEGGLRLVGGTSPPGFNQGSQSSSGPAPIPGNWGWFSWHPVSWRPTANIRDGDNLLTFLRGVNQCLRGVERT